MFLFQFCFTFCKTLYLNCSHPYPFRQLFSGYHFYFADFPPFFTIYLYKITIFKFPFGLFSYLLSKHFTQTPFIFYLFYFQLFFSILPGPKFETILHYVFLQYSPPDTGQPDIPAHSSVHPRWSVPDFLTYPCYQNR